MKYYYLVLLSIVVNSAFAQVQRAFITKDGKYSNDPQNAVSYLLIKKLNVDSAYSVKQYDIHDTIMVSGTYKDELLTIPNGKFVYYHKNYSEKNIQSMPPDFHIDTNNYIQTVGYFLNGKREGVWIYYASRGKIGQECTFEHGKLNGPYTTFYDGEVSFRTEGTMVNDLLEGKYYVYNADSLLVAESDYVHDKEVKHIDHLQEATESEKFHWYLEKALGKYKKQLTEYVPIVRFVVAKTGTLKDIQIIKGITPEVDTAIIAALSKAPAFTPAKYDNLIAEEKVTRPILLFHDAVVGPGGARGLPHLTHFRQRFDSLIPQSQAGGGIKPGVNYQQ